jgi:hypothetical protein
MFRCYCWLIFFAVAILSTWTFPADGNVDEKNLVVVENGNEKNEDINIESSILNKEDEDNDDDDEGIVENGTFDIADRGFKQKKPQKNPQKPQKDEDDSSSSEDEDEDGSSSSEEEDEDGSSSSEEKEKDKKKSKNQKCVCFNKKPGNHNNRGPPSGPGND